MVKIEPIGVKHLEDIYNTIEIRPLITVEPVGEKFGVVLIEDDKIKGGATGYKMDENCIVQKLILENEFNTIQYRDGVIRALINLTELSGGSYLYVNNDYMDGLFIAASRKCINSDDNRFLNDRKLSPEDYMITDLKAFFDTKGCAKNC